MNNLKSDKASVNKQALNINFKIEGNYYFDQSFQFDYQELKNTIENYIQDSIRYRDTYGIDIDFPKELSLEISIENERLGRGQYLVSADIDSSGYSNGHYEVIKFNTSLRRYNDEQMFDYLSFREDRDFIEEVEERAIPSSEYQNYITNLFDDDICSDIAERIVSTFETEKD